MTQHTATSNKGHWASNQGNCEEPVRVFHSKYSPTVDSNDIRFFSTQTALQKNECIVTLFAKLSSTKML